MNPHDFLNLLEGSTPRPESPTQCHYTEALETFANLCSPRARANQLPKANRPCGARFIWALRDAHGAASRQENDAGREAWKETMEALGIASPCEATKQKAWVAASKKRAEVRAKQYLQLTALIPIIHLNKNKEEKT